MPFFYLSWMRGTDHGWVTHTNTPQHTNKKDQHLFDIWDMIQGIAHTHTRTYSGTDKYCSNTNVCAAGDYEGVRRTPVIFKNNLHQKMLHIC